MENSTLDNNPAGGAEQEIDLVELVKRLWAKRKFIIKVTGTFMIVGLLVAIFSAKEYTASCIVVPQTGEKAMGGSLSGLAAMAGISLGNIGSGETLSPKVYSKVMNNMNLQKELIYTEINLEGFDHPVTLLDYFTKKEYQKFSLTGFVMKYTIGLPGVILKALRGKPGDNTLLAAGVNPEFLQLSNEEERCVNILKSKINLTINDKDGYVSISANMPEPLAAAQVAEKVMDLIQKYVTEFKIEKAKANYDFIKQRFEEAKTVYSQRQEEYARFRDANKNITSALAATREEQIKNDYNLSYSLYSELAKQLVQAEVKVKEDTPILTVVEPVVVPREKSKPKRAMILIAFTFLGGILACGSVFAFDFLKQHTEIKYLKDWN